MKSSVASRGLIGLQSGFFGRGDMQREFEDMAFSLKPGEVSSVVDTASGVHLIERYKVFFTASREPMANRDSRLE